MFETLQDAIKHYAKCMKCTISEAKADAEREIALLMKNEGYTREFAESTWMEEQEELDAKELDKLDKEAKKNGATKVVATDTEKPKRKRAPRKPNEEKRLLVTELWHFLETNAQIGATSIETVNPEREISFKIGENHYSLTLMLHRKPKGET